MKIFISIAGVIVVIVTGCLGAYLVVRDLTTAHAVKLEYIEKANTEQKYALEKIETKLSEVEKALVKLAGEIKHLKKGNYYEASNRSINDDDRGRFVIRNRNGL